MKNMENLKIKSVNLINVDDVENRQLKITLSNGTVITAEACHESWEQFGGTVDELRVTCSTVERYNAWLHGEDDDND